MKIHELKTVPPYFSQIVSGEKSFEIRKNDRGFQVGDRLLLREYMPEKVYSGQFVFVDVVYMIDNYYGIESGYCVLGIKLVGTR